jgi:thiamine pyrophosphate-dependent acetolactate synthase large subunit-like protein
LQRVDALKTLSGLTTTDDLFTSAVGIIWDDWWNYRPGGVDNTFSPAAIGSVSALALGLAIARPNRRVIALDTDGSLLMNTGILCTLGAERPSNLTILVLDNGIYESIGGPLSLTSFNTDLAAMATGAGCTNCVTVDDIQAFETEVSRLLDDDEFGLLVAKIEPGINRWAWHERKPTDGVEDKYRFLRRMERQEGIVIHPGAPQSHVSE